jgi:hypothetical protein
MKVFSVFQIQMHITIAAALAFSSSRVRRASLAYSAPPLSDITLSGFLSKSSCIRRKNSSADVPMEANIRALYLLVGSGGGLRSISVTTAIERAPFFPTARTAKK